MRLERQFAAITTGDRVVRDCEQLIPDLEFTYKVNFVNAEEIIT